MATVIIGQKPIRQHPALARLVVPTNTVLTQTNQWLSLESLIFYLLMRRRGTLAHELGHALGFEKASHSKSPAVTQRSSDKTVLELLTGWRSAMCPGRARKVTDLKTRDFDEGYKAGGIPEAVRRVKFDSPEEKQLFIEYFRDLAVTMLAGPKLENYLIGRQAIPFGEATDLLQARRIAKIIAELEKPATGWSRKERRAFIKQEMQRTRENTESFLTGLDVTKVRGILDTMTSEARNGKKLWTRGELEKHFEGLFPA